MFIHKYPKKNTKNNYDFSFVVAVCVPCKFLWWFLQNAIFAASIPADNAAAGGFVPFKRYYFDARLVRCTRTFKSKSLARRFPGGGPGLGFLEDTIQRRCFGSRGWPVKTGSCRWLQTKKGAMLRLFSFGVWNISCRIQSLRFRQKTFP